MSNNICLLNSSQNPNWLNSSFVTSIEGQSREHRIIDYSGNRLRQNLDGSLEVIPKPMAYVLGESIRYSIDKIYDFTHWVFSFFRKANSQDLAAKKIRKIDPPRNLIHDKTRLGSNPTEREVLASLQTQIDSLEWKEKLTVTPPRPSRSYPIKKAEGENWINAHVCELQRKAARALVEGTRHVTQSEFETELKKSVDQFNQWLESQDSKEYLLVVSPKVKSNHWVAQLALPHLKILPTQVFRTTNHQLPPDLLEYHQHHPEINKIVFFDDAAYGCSQSKYLICGLSKLDWISECDESGQRCDKKRLNELLSKEKDYTIAAIIPFMRDPACILPSSDVEEVCSPKPKVETHIRVFTSQKLHTVGDILTEEESKSISCDSDKIPVYFDHKMADSLSTCESIYKKGDVKVTYGYCDEDWGPEPSIWEKMYVRIMGGYSSQEREASLRHNQRSSEKRLAFEGVDTKFVDDIHPPYKG